MRGVFRRCGHRIELPAVGTPRPYHHTCMKKATWSVGGYFPDRAPGQRWEYYSRCVDHMEPTERGLIDRGAQVTSVGAL